MDKKLLERVHYPTKNGELSYAAGLVFCHHDAPIHRITTLARNLADLAKKDYPYEKSAVAYQILESFDHAGIEIEAHRKNRLDNLADPKDLLVTADKMKRLEEIVQELKDKHFSRRKSYQIIKAVLANDSKLVDVLQEKIAEDFPTIPALIDELKTLCGTKNAHWLHLTDLWDFIALNEEGQQP
jgi:CRISPR/Cas system-associated protein Cas10 (large subunit of type III CRISPR-Cas system)